MHVSNQCLCFERDLQNVILILLLNYLEIFVDSIVLCCCTYLKIYLISFNQVVTIHGKSIRNAVTLQSSYFQDFGIAFIN